MPSITGVGLIQSVEDLKTKTKTKRPSSPHKREFSSRFSSSASLALPGFTVLIQADCLDTQIGILALGYILLSMEYDPIFVLASSKAISSSGCDFHLVLGLLVYPVDLDT